MARKYRSKILPKGALIEYIKQGAYVKVCAVDPVTTVEVVLVGDPSAGADRLGREAVKKLEYVLRKAAKEQSSGRSVDARNAKGTPRGRRPESPSGWDL